MTAPVSKARAKPRAKAATLSTYDARPFFDKALAHGVQNGLIDSSVLQALRIDGAKGMVQIAGFFGTAFLRANLDAARNRLIALASLYLEDYSGGDLHKAAMSLRDNSFLSHSRGGSEMLKKLHAMPKSTLFGDREAEPVKDFLDEWSMHGLRIFSLYRVAFAERQGIAQVLDAAAWFAAQMGIARSSLAINSADDRYLASAEAVIRTAILQRIGKDSACPNRADFARLVLGLRKKSAVAGLKKMLKTTPEDIPEAFRDLEKKIRRQIEQYDLPKMIDEDIALDVLLNELEARYFLRPTGIEEVSEYDAMVSAEWHKVMKGRIEPDARLTVFLCLAAGTPPKPTLSETAAKAMVRKLRANGIDSKAVQNFIEQSAPYDLRESLLALWKDEFLLDAELALLDASDSKCIAAMKFLRENCSITVLPKKTA
jgi:hypothetical protein